MARGVAKDPDGLWMAVHDVCVPNQRIFSNPAPCVKVDLVGGYAILKDPKPTAPTHFLLIPTDRVTGIEDPAILRPGGTNEWAQAWRARHYVEQRVGRILGRDEISLAINSVDGRSQNQLHIHIDCIRPDVRAALMRHAGSIGPNWAPFPVPLAGAPYLAMRVEGSDLNGIDPFQLLAALPDARADMGGRSLVVTGETDAAGQAGFILLTGSTVPGLGDAGGEALQDHQCTLARQAPLR